MKTIYVIVALCVSYLSIANNVIDTIYSEKLGEERSFSVSLPASYEYDDSKSYPLLVVLDGEYLSKPFEGVLQYGNYWEDLPEVIIVGINQNYDNKRFSDSEFNPNGLPSENGAKFFEFIGQELLPHIQDKYRVNPFKIIAGHDTTAGFLNFFLYKEKPIFNAYISLAPEMAPEMENRLAVRFSEIKTTIFYYQASSENDISSIKKGMKILDENIQNIQNTNFYYLFDNFENTSHYSFVTQAIPKALYFIFEGYQPISIVEFKEKIMPLESGYAQYLIDKYNNLENKLGIKITPRLTDFKAIEVAILKNKAYEELENLAKYAEKHYPKTTLGAYHKALYYEKTEDYKRAVKEYGNAYTKEPVRELTKDFMFNKMEKLKNKSN